MLTSPCEHWTSALPLFLVASCNFGSYEFFIASSGCMMQLYSSWRPDAAKASPGQTPSMDRFAADMLFVKLQCQARTAGRESGPGEAQRCPHTSYLPIAPAQSASILQKPPRCLTPPLSKSTT